MQLRSKSWVLIQKFSFSFCHRSLSGIFKVRYHLQVEKRGRAGAAFQNSPYQRVWWALTNFRTSIKKLRQFEHFHICAKRTVLHPKVGYLHYLQERKWRATLPLRSFGVTRMSQTYNIIEASSLHPKRLRKSLNQFFKTPWYGAKWNNS